MPIYSEKKSPQDATANPHEEILSERMFRESLEEVRAAAEAAKDGLPDGISCAEDPACREAELMVELYRAYHDNYGAFKSKRLVQDMVGLFDPSGERPAVELVSAETGEEFALPHELSQRRMLIVGMTELDRLNKGGNNAAGDAGLRACVKAIDEASVATLGEGRAMEKSVYRFGGNEFCVVFENVSDDELRVLEGKIINAELDMGTWKGVEPPPLSCARLNFSEVVGILNDAEARLPEDERVERREAGYKASGIMRRAGEYRLEIAKFVTRVDRAVEKLAAVKAGEITHDDAKSFFDSYLKKAFGGTEIDSLEDVERMWADGKGGFAFREGVERMAAESARARFASDRQFELYEEHIVEARFLSSVTRPEAVAHAEKNFNVEGKVAVVVKTTEGLEEIARKSAAMKAAQGTAWQRSARLEYLLEAARRDEGTGLLERGQFYEDWNAQTAEAEAVGEDAAMVFIDMGFLKYFNDAGGRAVGDAALRQSAAIMEDAIRESGVRAQAYRYGGDEFVIRVEGGKAEAQKVVQAIERIRVHVGKIPDLAGLRRQLGEPASGESRADYAPTELVFNAGVAELADFYATAEHLKAAGQLDAVLESRGLARGELLAELTVKLADVSVGFEKAASRFRLLLDMMDDPAYADEKSSYHARVESVIKYSQKAIFGSLGGDAALRIFHESRKHESDEELEAQIERFVSDRLERVKKIVNADKDTVDKLVELHAAANRLSERVRELESEIDKERSGRETAEGHVEALKNQRDEARAAYEKLVQARQEVRGAALDKVA